MDDIGLTHTDAPYPAVFNITDYGTRPFMRATPQDGGVLFLCVTAGKLKASGKGLEKTLSEGDCLSMALGHGYRLQRDGEESCAATYIVASGAFVYDLMQLYGITDLMSAKAPDALEALTEIHRVMSGTDGTADERDMESAEAFHRFILKLRRASRLGGKTGSAGTAEEIKRYIDSHLEGKMTLDELSKIFFVSKTQIFRIFKEAYGVAPIQYFLREKIELAKKLLSESEMKISEISEVLAFTDAKHFSKTFRKFVGELPKNYRRHNGPRA